MPNLMSPIRALDKINSAKNGKFNVASRVRIYHTQTDHTEEEVVGHKNLRSKQSSQNNRYTVYAAENPVFRGTTRTEMKAGHSHSNDHHSPGAISNGSIRLLMNHNNDGTLESASKVVHSRAQANKYAFMGGKDTVASAGPLVATPTGEERLAPLELDDTVASPRNFVSNKKTKHAERRRHESTKVAFSSAFFSKKKDD